MNNPNTPRFDATNEKIRDEKDKTLEHADALYQQVKSKANEMYEGGKQTVSEAQDQLKHQTENLAEHVREKPLASLLIAGGIGFILSAIFKR
ncbi:MAG: hypothetical protein H0U70_02910 [Tatlockia sp.]|nr:hypothetical protein [Tatlockia sp.]